MNEIYKLKRDWETPFTKFYKGHTNNSETWAKIFGISQIEFYQYLEEGYFKDWLKLDVGQNEAGEQHIKTEDDDVLTTDLLTEYQLEVRTRLRRRFEPFCKIEIGRGDRLLVDGQIMKGFLVNETKFKNDYEADINFFSEEIIRQI